MRCPAHFGPLKPAATQLIGARYYCKQCAAFLSRDLPEPQAEPDANRAALRRVEARVWELDASPANAKDA